MPKPKAILSFEDKTVELEEAQLTRIGKLLLKDDVSHQNIKEFNDLYIPVMSVASAISAWREPTPPLSEISFTIRTPIYSSGTAEYFMDDHPEFGRSVISANGELIRTFPLLIAKNPTSPINLLSFTEEEDTDLTDVILGVTVQRVYVELAGEINAIDLSGNPTARFIPGIESGRILQLVLSTANSMIKLSAVCDTERGNVNFHSCGGVEVLAVDLEVERRHYSSGPPA